MKNRCLLLSLIIPLICIGCAEKVETIDIQENIAEYYFPEHLYNRGAKDIDADGYEIENYVIDQYIPIIYQGNYEDVLLGNGKSVAEQGNQLVCLCMLESYTDKKICTPKDFLKRFQNQIDDNGLAYNLIDTLKEIAGDDGEVYEKPFDLQMLSEELNTPNTNALIYIPHNSIYGKNAAYLIVEDIDPNDLIMIRDPIMQNIEKYGQFDKITNVPMYDAYDFIVAAGNDSLMYIIRGGND